MNSSLIEQVKSNARGNDIIVSFCSRNYIAQLTRLIDSFKKLSINNYIIISLDSETHNCIAPKHSFCSPMPIATRATIWIRRMNIMNVIVNSGFNLLHVDVDSVFRKRPFDYFRKHACSGDNNIDNLACMFFGQGSTFPECVYKQQRFVARGGLHYTISNETTKKIWQGFFKLTKRFRDDQIAINRYLYDNIKWDPLPPERYDLVYKNRPGKRYKYTGFYEPVYGKTTDGRYVCLLPHHLFSRYKTGNTCIMYHDEMP